MISYEKLRLGKMDGIMILSCQGGLLLYDLALDSKKQFGLSESKDSLNISSLLYAIYCNMSELEFPDSSFSITSEESNKYYFLYEMQFVKLHFYSQVYFILFFQFSFSCVLCVCFFLVKS